MQVAKQWRDADRPCNLQAKKMEISLGGLVQEDSNRSRPSSSLSIHYIHFVSSTFDTAYQPCCFCISGGHRGGTCNRIDTADGQPSNSLRNVHSPTSIDASFSRRAHPFHGRKLRKESDEAGERGEMNGSLRRCLNWATFSFEVTF